jgi:hypothetical protein
LNEDYLKYQFEKSAKYNHHLYRKINSIKKIPNLQLNQTNAFNNNKNPVLHMLESLCNKNELRESEVKLIKSLNKKKRRLVFVEHRVYL